MKKQLAILVISLLSASVIGSTIASASTVKVKGYTKKNGTYVSGYTKTKSDSSKSNNYSSKGNSNPYTGKKGTVAY